MTEAVADPHRVEANADKALFVSMLVKDIELLPAVMDLVDNSVDGARSVSPGNFSNHRIDITVDKTKFVIADDCGGIDLSVARNYAFRFGRPADYPGVPGSVGQFGVGMKRALFKLGRHFEVNSRTTTTAFKLPVNVESWAADTNPDWHFEMEMVDESYDPISSGVGTTISVTGLHESVAEDFGSILVLGQLRHQIRLRHQSAIQEGLQIRLNGDLLQGFMPQLLSGPDFSPISKRLVIPGGKGHDVNVHIVAGLAAAAEDNIDEGQGEKFRGTNDAGWWLFCNDRLLLFAERSSLTGWGDSAPSYHPQYRHFRGYVYLTSLDTSLLPWNTTKTSVDQDSRIWRTVQNEMKTALNQVLSVVNRMKTERENSEDSDDRPIHTALTGAKATPVRNVRSSTTFVVPKPKPVSKQVTKKNTVQKIQYSVDRDRYIEVANLLQAPTAADVGRYTFDYFYEREVEG